MQIGERFSSSTLRPLGLILTKPTRKELGVIQFGAQSDKLLYTSSPQQHAYSTLRLLTESDSKTYYNEVYADMLQSWMSTEIDPRRKFIGNPQGATILDYGCGNGQITQGLVDHNEVHGTDIADSLIQIANRKGIFAQLHDANSDLLPYKNDMFDDIFAFDVFEHIHNHTLALSEIFRTLKVGGVLKMTVPILRPHTMEDNNMFHEETVKDLGINHSLALCEPEVNVLTLQNWVKVMTDLGFTLLTRAYGYDWNIDPENQLSLLQNSAIDAPNAFFLWMKKPERTTQLINWRVACGAWSWEEMFDCCEEQFVRFTPNH